MQRLKSFNYFIPVFGTFQKIIFEGILLYREKEGSIEGRGRREGREAGEEKERHERRGQEKTAKNNLLRFSVPEKRDLVIE